MNKDKGRKIRSHSLNSNPREVGVKTRLNSLRNIFMSKYTKIFGGKTKTNKKEPQINLKSSYNRSSSVTKSRPACVRSLNMIAPKFEYRFEYYVKAKMT